jgi:hypothetical protein
MFSPLLMWCPSCTEEPLPKSDECLEVSLSMFRSRLNLVIRKIGRETLAPSLSPEVSGILGHPAP